MMQGADAPTKGGAPPSPTRFSIVIPTFNRRDIVAASLRALERQPLDVPFEVVVVVDGSSDGTAIHLKSLKPSFPLTVLEQPNAGASVARNRGAEAARGEILLFLDDDMEAHPNLLAEHDMSHREGADVVIGHLPLHPESPSGVLSRGVASWAEARRERLSEPGAQLSLHDLLTGQISVPRCLFHAVGGFDTAFTRDGSFGNEDIDFGYRLQQRGCRVAFNPRAISWQRYVVEPRAYFRQWRQAGRADVAFARKHPETAGAVFALHNVSHPSTRWLWRPVVAMPLVAPLVTWMACSAARVIAKSGSVGLLARRALAAGRALQYWQGVREAGGIPAEDPPRVLAYHSISEQPPDSPVGPWAVPPSLLAKQIDTLLAAGFHFVTAGDIVDYLGGRKALPPRAVLLTFDDCYADLLHAALPILGARGIPAVAFAVSQQLGGVNAWDHAIGAPRQRLLDADELRALASAGVEIGGHSRTHRQLPSLPPTELVAEVDGCMRELEAAGLPRPRLYSYPYGECNRNVRAALRAAGMKAAFTVCPAPLTPDADPLLLPRIEVMAADVHHRFARTVASPGRWRARAAKKLEQDISRAWERAAVPAVELPHVRKLTTVGASSSD